MKINTETGEIIAENIMALTDKAPAIIIDVSDVAVYHTEPMKLVEKINAQAGYVVFDVTTKKGREACRAHAAQIIKCIAPACNESKRLAAEAKKVVNQDIMFRKIIDTAIREIAAYHRRPLTELEEQEAEIKAAEELAALKIEEARLYLISWDDAIAFNELVDLRREKAKRDAEIEALRKLKEQEEYDRQLQEKAIEQERERVEEELQEKIRLEQHQRDIDIELHESKIEIKKEEIAEPITIPQTEYLKLKGDSEQLWKIIELWHQAKRMSECAERADSSSARNKELVEARKVRQQAIDIIENR